MTVHFSPLCETNPADLAFAVIAARYRGQWLLVRHRERSTWEIPGGHREPGEDITATARRELWEETGASDFDLVPVCRYHVDDNASRAGILFLAQIRALGELPPSEIAERRLFDELPDNLTYPEIQPHLHGRAYRAPFVGGSPYPIRRAVAEDYADFARVLCQCWRETYAGLIPDDVLDRNTDEVHRRQMFASIMGKRGQFYAIAFDGLRPVGIVNAGVSREDGDPADMGELAAIYTLAETYGSGLGQALFDAAMDALRGMGMAQAKLFVLEANGRARRFYEKNGFTLTDRLPYGGPGETPLVCYQRVL
ncbi:MAG: GNAT family N-acetyltransferase [Clostridia bacterium]|nr:GNAT family N-acetyltransferase [Clostridia bacterium]